MAQGTTALAEGGGASSGLVGYAESCREQAVMAAEIVCLFLQLSEAGSKQEAIKVASVEWFKTGRSSLPVWMQWLRERCYLDICLS